MSVLDRIEAQIKEATRFRPDPWPFLRLHGIEKKILPKPIGAGRLRKLLMETNESIKVDGQIVTDIVFGGVELFVSWYEPLTSQFSPTQQMALNTLVAAAKSIHAGCGCKSHKRRAAAEAYYGTFWKENAKTDLPHRVLEVAATQRVVFRLPDPNAEAILIIEKQDE